MSHSYQTFFSFPGSDLNLDCGLRDHVITRFRIKRFEGPRKTFSFLLSCTQHLVARFGLVETHVRDVNKDSVSRLLFQNWSDLFNYDQSNGGHIWVC